MTLEITIKSNDRIIGAGQTGSGKTHAAIEMLADAQRLVVIDSKPNHKLMQEMNLVRADKKEWRKLTRGKLARIHVTPPIATPANLFNYFERLFHRLYVTADLMIYIDEATAVVQSPTVFPTYLQAIYQRGRELGIGVWSSTQRPVFIPNFMMTESSKFFCFSLLMQEDRDKMAGMMGQEVRDPIEDRHGFWYYDQPERALEYVPEL